MATARRDLLALLPVGRDHAMSAWTLSVALGISERVVGALVAELIEQHGICIGSLCGVRSGYFIIESLEDLEAGAGHSVRRAAAIFRRIRALRKAWERKPGGVQTTLFAMLDEESDPAVASPQAAVAGSGVTSGAEAGTPTGEGASAPGSTPDLDAVLAEGGWAEWVDA